MMQSVEARCNTLQHTATRCNTLQHTATHGVEAQCVVSPASRGDVSPPQHHGVRELASPPVLGGQGSVRESATHCSILQPPATHCNTLQHTATHCNTQGSVSAPHIAVAPRNTHTRPHNPHTHERTHVHDMESARVALERRGLPVSDEIPRSEDAVLLGVSVISGFGWEYGGDLSESMIPISNVHLRCVAVYCIVLQCIAACCSVLQRVAVCCSITGTP